MEPLATNQDGKKRKLVRGAVGSKSRKERRRLPDQRTVRVLFALVVGMTAFSSILMLLDPGPVHRGPSLALSAMEQNDPQSIEAALFNTNKPLRVDDWQYIIIHDSRGQTGSLENLEQAWNRYYADRGLAQRGAGYHFVIDDAASGADGRVEVCQRWQEQYPGGYIDTEGDDHWNRIAIGVCLMGDADSRPFSHDQIESLARLTRELQQKFGIPRENVIVQVGQTEAPALFFPEAEFRRRLAD